MDIGKFLWGAVLAILFLYFLVRFVRAAFRSRGVKYMSSTIGSASCCHCRQSVWRSISSSFVSSEAARCRGPAARQA